MAPTNIPKIWDKGPTEVKGMKLPYNVSERKDGYVTISDFKKAMQNLPRENQVFDLAYTPNPIAEKFKLSSGYCLPTMRCLHSFQNSCEIWCFGWAYDKWEECKKENHMDFIILKKLKSGKAVIKIEINSFFYDFAKGKKMIAREHLNLLKGWLKKHNGDQKVSLPEIFMNFIEEFVVVWWRGDQLEWNPKTKEHVLIVPQDDSSKQGDSKKPIELVLDDYWTGREMLLTTHDPVTNNSDFVPTKYNGVCIQKGCHFLIHEPQNSLMMLLHYGHTFYSRFGFMPLNDPDTLNNMDPDCLDYPERKKLYAQLVYQFIEFEASLKSTLIETVDNSNKKALQTRKNNIDAIDKAMSFYSKSILCSKYVKCIPPVAQQKNTKYGVSILRYNKGNKKFEGDEYFDGKDYIEEQLLMKKNPEYRIFKPEQITSDRPCKLMRLLLPILKTFMLHVMKELTVTLIQKKRKMTKDTTKD